ncbi:membrane-associated protein, putative [Bodo saltans]|uniref:Membrane-associated protein, putative n=1 Tax=Bodo saltans TaxID=75058 RepID=A0A0S4JDK2_BODSA|nr:membrane-associated protein, putative [Bodo saltans]|eukprot:CUG88354.1 membrane-associated protein, putative [Bodo saltans]
MMPIVPPDRMFVRRERHFASPTPGGVNNDQLLPAPSLLKLRVLVFSLLFYSISTVALWSFPIVAGVLSYPVLQHGPAWLEGSWFGGSSNNNVISGDGGECPVSALAIVCASIALPLLAIDPFLFTKCLVEVPIVMIGISVMSLIQVGKGIWDVLEPMMKSVVYYCSSPGVVVWLENDLLHALDAFVFPPRRHVPGKKAPLIPAVSDSSSRVEPWADSDDEFSEVDDDQWMPL